jgi:hypothetical protein
MRAHAPSPRRLGVGRFDCGVGRTRIIGRSAGHAAPGTTGTFDNTAANGRAMFARPAPTDAPPLPLDVATPPSL